MNTVNDAIRLKRLTDVVVQSFDESDWVILETTLEGGNLISQHERLYRSMSFGDDDYAYCVAEVLQGLSSNAPANLKAIEDYVAGVYGEPGPSPMGVYELAMLGKRGPCSLFISHKAEEKAFAAALKNALAPYGIASFVAHEDIAVTAEWEREIECMLSTCDAFVYLSSAASNGSEWCQQEIGWAFGRGIPMMSVALGANPVGFFGARQALRIGAQFDHNAVAQAVFDTLVVDVRASHLIVDGLIDNLSDSVRYDDSNWYAMRLASVPAITAEQAERIEAAIANNDQVRNANHGTLPESLRKMIAEKLGSALQSCNVQPL